MVWGSEFREFISGSLKFRGNAPLFLPMPGAMLTSLLFALYRSLYKTTIIVISFREARGTRREGLPYIVSGDDIATLNLYRATD